MASTSKQASEVHRERALIFLTVGTQLSFDRLVRALDQIQPSLGIPVIAQVASGDYSPTNFLETYENLSKTKYDDIFSRASIIVSHAGMGTIITARLSGKPIIVMPRIAANGEHRNDHQTSTCTHLTGIDSLYVAKDCNELSGAILHAWEQPSVQTLKEPAELVENLRCSIFRNQARRD